MGQIDMKKLLTLLLALCSLSAFGAANDMIQQQRNAFDTGTLTRITTIPAGGQDGLYFFNGSTVLPGFVTLGAGLSVSSGTLNVSDITGGQIATALGFTPYDASNPAGYINQSGARSSISLTTTGSGSATYNASTGELNVPTPSIPAAPSQSSASRSFNTAFQVSSTRSAIVTYSVQITVTASIAGGQNGDVILEIASDSGFTANVQILSIAGNGQTYTLAIALQGIQPNTNVVSGFIPAGYYVRLRTVQNTGTPSFSYRSGQEVLM